jgi:hypothetical protein
LIHEKVSGLLGSEAPALVFYGAASTVYLFALIRRGVPNWPLLVVPLAFFALSALMDRNMHGTHGNALILLEDGPKLIGAFSWTAFHFGLALNMVTARLGVVP